MYKQSSPEALSLASLGRADSKPPDRTCSGITTVGKACRNPLKKGSPDKYCHLHKDQSGTFRLDARTTTPVVVEYDSPNEAHRVRPQMHVKNTATVSSNAYPMLSPSPPPKVSPIRKPVPSIWNPPQSQGRPPSIAPPTRPSSSHSFTPKPVHRKNGGMSKFAMILRRLFLLEKSKPASVKLYPSLGTTFCRTHELGPSRYPQTISSPTLPIPDPHKRLPPSPTATPPPKQPPQNPILPPYPRRTPKNSTYLNPPLIQSRPPTSAMAMAQSRTRTGVHRSWETLWVPGTNGLGTHITCNQWLNSNLTPEGSQELLSCMRTPLSAGEQPGYIYVFKISESDDVHYKVGRTQNITRRLHQWGRSCVYTPLLVEYFPSAPGLKRTCSSSSLNSLFRAGEIRETVHRATKCAFTHRVERLIHLELEDRFGRVDIAKDGCSCGKIHKEWFHGGGGEDGGWPEVREVIMRWVGFAKFAYGEVEC